MTTPTFSRWPALVIGSSVVLSVAWFLRLAFLPEELLVVTDQARALLAGRNILLGNMTLTGPETSVAGLSLGPFFYYMVAVALWLSNFAPVGPALMTIGTSVGLCLGLFWWLRTRATTTVAMLASLFTATSPLIVHQSRLAVEPTPLPFFMFLWCVVTERWLTTKNYIWLALNLLLIVLCIQLNFSAIMLGLALVFLGLRHIPQPQRRLVLSVLSTAIIAAICLKALVRPTTSTIEYFANIWLQLTTPSSSLVATLLLAIAGFGLYRLFQLRDEHGARVLLTATLCGALGFLTKTVGGEHALGLLFPVVGIAIAVGLQPLLCRVPTVVTLVTVLLFFFGQTLTVLPLLHTEVPHRWSEHEKVAEKVLQLAAGEPYTFVYRGHLDIYAAADDHWQYALWRAGQPPTASYLREVGEQPERWLLDHSARTTEKTIYLYFPAERALEFPVLGTRHPFGSVILEVVESPPGRV